MYGQFDKPKTFDKPKRNIMSNQNNPLQGVWNIIALLGLALAGVIALAITTTILLSQRTNLRITTNNNDPNAGAIVSESEHFGSLNAIPCTNKTLGDEKKTFSGTTYLGIPCPRSDNPCSESICGTNGYCTETVIDGGECFVNTQCGSGSSCNSTCMCEPMPDSPECSIDSDCQQFDGNPCLETLCIDNMCITNLTIGSECSSSTQCDSGFSCNSTCMCEPIISSSGCLDDNDCEQFSGNPCLDTLCVNNMCVTNLTAGAECSSTTQCGDGFSCNTTCMCEQVFVPSLTWQTYVPTVQAGSNIGGASLNFYDGVYYRVSNGFIEMTIYVESVESTSSAVLKTMIINTPPLITLDVLTNGVGVFTAGVGTPYSVSTTVWKGSGGAYINSATQIAFYVYADDIPTGASTGIGHTVSGTFVGRLA